MYHFLKGKTVDTTTLVSVTLLHMNFTFYHFSYIRGLSAHITIIDSKSCMLFFFPTAKKRRPLYIIKFILAITTPLQYNNSWWEWHIIKFNIPHIYISRFLIYPWILQLYKPHGLMENIWNFRSIQNILSSNLLDSNQNEDKWYYTI